MEDLVASPLRDKRVLVTGDTGFKGSWLSLWLHRIGANVLGLALPPQTGRDHFNVLGLGKVISHVDCDIRDLSELEKATADFKPEVVFHLAAQALVKHSYSSPKATFDTNVGGSVNVLELVRQSPSVRVLVYVTSDKCYRNRQWVWGYRENDELGGEDPYSASKAAAEMVFSAYLKSFFETRDSLGAASVRAGNAIGGGDWADDRLVPDCIRALSSGEPIVLRNPAAIRPWQHVLEPISGYIRLAGRLMEEPSRYSGAWNFGPELATVHTVRELAERVVERWPGGVIRVEKADDGRREAQALQLSIDKVKAELEWTPRWDFGEAVDRTVDWYRRVQDDTSAWEVSMGQIMDYCEERE